MNGEKLLELYIHIPFCLKKCLYCDFLSGRFPLTTQAEYMDQLRCEIKASALEYETYLVDTVFIGGGTPSVLEAEQITLLMEALKRSFRISPEAEITIEANPGTRLAHKLPKYRQAGINRLSMGLQSTSNEELKYLGRAHLFEDFLKGYQSARMAGFQNINVDLMSGIPGQTIESWQSTLRRVIMLKPEHISAYSLMVEKGTVFGDHYPPDWPPIPDEETDREMYHLTKELLKEAGYHRYEISNYAKEGSECRHNMGYWSGQQYLGLGLGASSYIKKQRFANIKAMDQYLELDFSMNGLEQVKENIHPLSRNEQMEEFMFLGLRMSKGVSDIGFFREFGVHISDVYQEALSRLMENNLLKQEFGRYCLTDWGMDVSNVVLSEFLF